MRALHTRPSTRSLRRPSARSSEGVCCGGLAVVLMIQSMSAANVAAPSPSHTAGTGGKSRVQCSTQRSSSSQRDSGSVGRRSRPAGGEAMELLDGCEWGGACKGTVQTRSYKSRLRANAVHVVEKQGW